MRKENIVVFVTLFIVCIIVVGVRGGTCGSDCTWEVLSNRTLVISGTGKMDDFSNGNILLLEVDGTYHHSDPRVVSEDKMNPMQKRNRRVDEYKNKWALEHGIPLLRIWEKDIRENPKLVMDTLMKRLYIVNEVVLNNEKLKKRHVNKIK